MLFFSLMVSLYSFLLMKMIRYWKESFSVNMVLSKTNAMATGEFINVIIDIQKQVSAGKSEIFENGQQDSSTLRVRSCAHS